MREGDFAPFDEGGGAVAVDETFIGNDRTPAWRRNRKSGAALLVPFRDLVLAWMRSGT